MSVLPFPRRAPFAVPGAAYFRAEPPAEPILRALTALEQMYAYWGSDRL